MIGSYAQASDQIYLLLQALGNNCTSLLSIEYRIGLLVVKSRGL